jgi:anti-sigma regulatory factor (Ser/Thr protein kinase)
VATAEALDGLHAGLSRFWARCTAVLPTDSSDTWRIAFATAVAEVAANVIRYAYPGRPDGQLRVELRAYRDRVEAVVVDHGVPFVEPDLSVDPLRGDLPESGRGLTIVRAAVDQLSYERSDDGANRWVLTLAIS